MSKWKGVVQFTKKWRGRAALQPDPMIKTSDLPIKNIHDSRYVIQNDIFVLQLSHLCAYHTIEVMYTQEIEYLHGIRDKNWKRNKQL